MVRDIALHRWRQGAADAPPRRRGRCDGRARSAPGARARRGRDRRARRREGSVAGAAACVARPRRARPRIRAPAGDGAGAARRRAAAPRRRRPSRIPNLGNIIAISSGKGGVGKSTVATNLAVALAQQGARVGLMDADIYGPNIPRMMGVNGAAAGGEREDHPAPGARREDHEPRLHDRARPAGDLARPDHHEDHHPVPARRAWGELDYFLVDMPPGTGDAQLSLVQATTCTARSSSRRRRKSPSGDALRGAKMFERVGVPVLGIVENMSYFECPHCGKPSAALRLRRRRAARRRARACRCSAQIPLYPRVLRGRRHGRPIVVAEPDSVAARALSAIADSSARARYAER